jgi:putative DNA methylase
MIAPKKKLIEVALPLEAINKASAYEKSIRHGHPSTLHLWWARRPLAAARAVLFAQMVDDPSAHPDLFRTEKAQAIERQRLFRIIEQLVQWENTTNEKVLQAARDEIWQSWRAACADNVDHPRARELFNRNRLPGFHDPFAGGGALPLEAQRLGLESLASDLNPVSVLINKAMIELPPRFAGRAPVNPVASKTPSLLSKTWPRATGLAEDVRYYGSRLKDEAKKAVGHLYPSVEITSAMTRERPDLKQLLGQQLTVIAWLWARTVKSPNPAFSDVEVPLVSTFILGSKPGKEAYVLPVVGRGGYQFSVRVGITGGNAAKEGTKLARGSNFRCLMSGSPIPSEYIMQEGQSGRLGARLMAIVAEGEGGRVYLSPTPEHEEAARKANPTWKPDVEFFQQALGFRVGNYGLTKWSDLFSPRELVTLTTLADLIGVLHKEIERDAFAVALGDEASRRSEARGYADAVALYLAFAVDKSATYLNTLCRWLNQPKNEIVASSFSRQAVQMVWDNAEANPFSDSGGNIEKQLEYVVKAVQALGVGNAAGGRAEQSDAASQKLGADRVVSTDPPYYDNIGYADLSDFFYVWLRRSLKDVYPGLFGTVAVPKGEELVATPGRHGTKSDAESFFLRGMTKAMHRIAEQSHPAFPVSIYYAFKQSENDEEGTASTGWETFLAALIQSGFSVCGTWPVRTERESRTRGLESNALASSIVLVCRPRPANAPNATRRDFITELKTELPKAVLHLQRGNIAPVDLAQASIGPGMAVYSRYSQVVDAQGRPVPVRDALTLINQVLDESLAEQEGDFDADSRWALAWFGDHGFDAGPFGEAHTYFLRFNTAENGLKAAGIIESGRSKVRLLKPAELPPDWDPATDPRLTSWEVVHHLIQALDVGGEPSAAALVAKLGAKADTARELAYRLYSLCERKKRATEALAYNGLVQSWPEITRLAREGGMAPKSTQGALFDKDEE